ncbi:hypothetical protein [Sulfitobacter sp. PM12]|uniref:hypothetical protein n=1 Tax=Sulfitobacter sp. PM12 TaxID=3138497 RepID=UPI00388E43E9
MRIETSTKWGRVTVDMPDAMTEIERAEVFEDLAGFERAEKKPMGFGDFKMERTDGTAIACASTAFDAETECCLSCGERH